MIKHRFTHILVIIILLVSSYAINSAAGQSPQVTSSIIYVDLEAIGNNDGTSWTDAYTDLQPALETAASGDQIWVAAGTYYPSVEHCGTGERYKSFQLKNGVGLYGGFDPSTGDIGWSDRDWEGNATILSGDIGLPGDNSDNSHHVFCHPEGLNLDSSAVLDGFVIQDGNANPYYFPEGMGAGMFNYYSSSLGGGGMYNQSSSPILTNVTISNTNGVGMVNADSSPTLINVTFSNNNGGGMLNGGGSPTLINVSFSNNSTYDDGGGIYNQSSSPILFNVTFSNNHAYDLGGGMYNRMSSSPTLTNVTFSGNVADDGGGVYNDSSSPTLANVTFAGNTAMGHGGGMHNENSSSPTLTNVTFSGNTAGWAGGLYNNSFSFPTLLNVTFSGNTGISYIGGIRSESGSWPILTNCIMWGDTPGAEIDGDATVTYSDIQGSFTGEGNIDADPLLGILANNSGPTLTHALLEGSPAIDAGSPTTCPPFDQRGLTRPIDGDGDGNAVCDMGSYEYRLVTAWLYLALIVK